MTTFLYARVSSLAQNEDMQERELKAAHPNGIYRAEKQSGTSMHKREILALILDMIGEGDKLVVWKLDRLARNMADLMTIMKTLEDKGASLEILDQRIDTETASGKAFLQMLGVFSEFETNLRKERQLSGIAAAKAKGKHLGRRSSLSADQKKEIIELSKSGKNPSQLSKSFCVSRGTIYNILKGANSNA